MEIGGIVSLQFMSVAVIIMASALYIVWREEPRARSRVQRFALARTGFRLASISGLALAPAGLYGLGGQYWLVGMLVIVVGLVTALGAYALGERCRVLADRHAPPAR